MEEDGEDFSPFWDQGSANRRRGRRLSPSSCLNSGVLIFFLCITAILFLFFVIPSVLSLTSQIFRPNLVKKSWDSINVVLVLFALLFGFLSRNLNYDSTYSDQDHRNEVQKSNPTTPLRWYEYSDRTAFSSAPAAVGGLRRTHSSHPDLRGVSSWDAGEERWRFFDDTQVDAHRSLDLDGFLRRRSWKRVVEEEEEDGEGDGSSYSKTIHVDKMVSRSEEVPPTPPSPPPPVPEAEPAPPSPPPAPPINQKPRRSFESIPRSEKTNAVKSDDPEPLEPLTSPAAPVPVPHSVRRKHRRAHESVARREKGNGQVVDEADSEMSAPLPPPPPPSVPHSVRRKHKRAYETAAITEKRTEEVEKEREPQLEAPSPPQPAPQSPPTPPPAPLSPPTNSEKKTSKSERKRGTGTATKDFLLHFQRKKKKKQRQKSVENLQALFEPETSSHTSFPPPSPPPPPPPPPPSVFNNFFSSKKGKSKKFLSVPPPPPPPPRHRITTARASTSTTQSSQISSGKPPLPVKISSFSSVDENSNSGGESPMIGYGSPLNRIPPPPPPPPFRMPSWKFMVQGDYVRVGSVNSSRSVSPDLEDGESPRSDTSSEIAATVDGGEVAASPLFCPSPDVDTKADMFIAKFRAGLKIQKMNSMKQKQGLGLSNLGPDTKPRTSTKHI